MTFAVQHDIQRNLRPIPREMISAEERLSRFRQGQIERYVGRILPAASDFLQSISEQARVPDVRRHFVGATLMVENAMRILEAANFISRETLNSARSMFSELRNEAIETVEKLDGGLNSLLAYDQSEEAMSFYTGAKGKLEFIRKLADTQVKVRNPEAWSRIHSGPKANSPALQ